jgi:serine protease
MLIIGLTGTINDVRANSNDIQNAIRNSHRHYFPGELLVKFKAQIPIIATKSIHNNFGISEFRNGYNKYYQIIEVPPGKEKEIAKAYLERPEVEYAEPNYYRSLHSIPNDELYPFQWHLPLINLPEAWDITAGENVTVAVIDSGVNPFGRDSFGGRLLPGHNALLRLPGGIDFESHGTHVAGTIGQETNNGTGVAGIAYRAQILPVKSLSALTGIGLDSWIIHGIMWATDQGADIINMSLGGSFPSKAMEDAVNYAYERGVTLVASSGNDGHDGVSFPAAYEHCIAVGAVRLDKTVASYSNRGSALDLVAPGGDMNVDQNNDGQPDSILQETFWWFGISWGYWWFAGTSMSSPHVAGVAALVKAVHPEFGPDEIRMVLQDTAEDLGEPGWDQMYGYGLVDAYSAVSY